MPFRGWANRSKALRPSRPWRLSPNKKSVIACLWANRGRACAGWCLSNQIAREIDWLKDNFDKPFRVEDLAGRAGLSTSAFHNRFRATTAMSSLQFLRRMRLNEARRLMFTEHLDASSAAFEVGYESPSQFSREYGRLFGAPPARDTKNLSRISVS